MLCFHPVYVGLIYVSLVLPQQVVPSPETRVAPEVVRTGRVELLSRARHDSYERACFSFIAGQRGDRCRDRVGNNFELEFGSRGDEFRVRTVTDDESLILDLGPRTFEQIESLPELKAEHSDLVAAKEGHAYLVRTKDSRQRGMALFRVVALAPGDRCTIEWLAIPDPILPTNGLKLSDELRGRLGDLLARSIPPDPPKPVLASPRVRLQLRAGAGGGNPNRINMIGEKSMYVEKISATPLSFEKPVEMNDESTAFFEGGVIPAEKQLIVTRVKYRGTCAGDSNGHGELLIRVGKDVIVKREEQKEPVEGEWSGRIAILPGDEHLVFAEIANSSSADVEISGEFAELAEGN